MLSITNYGSGKTVKYNFKPNKKRLAVERHINVTGSQENILSLDMLDRDQIYNSTTIEPIGYVSERQCRRWRREDGLGAGEYY